MTNYFARPDSSTPFHTYLEPYLRLMEPCVRDYDWLWTEIEVAGEPPSIVPDDHGRIWLTGAQLLDYIYGGPQLIWSVLTAIFPHNRDAAVADSTVPLADGNHTCWSPDRGPQHPFGCLEIVCYDSSATLLIGGDDFAVDTFKKAFPNAAPIRIQDCG
jgi:hypothetical protein